MNNNNFQYSFTTAKKGEEVYDHLIEPRNWWVGFFSETIQGKSKEVNDEFSFMAGDGVHYSKLRLVECTPGKKIEWLVTESNLSFVKNTNEWVGTRVCFDIAASGSGAEVTFTHKGLAPQIECYDRCSAAWTQYLHQLAKLFSQ